MKLKITLLSLLLIFTFTFCKQGDNVTAKNKISKIDTASNEAGRLLPKQLRYIPFGLIIQHYPNPCYPELENGKYVWKHNTTVTANKDLKIIEYGSFVYTKKGWYLRVTNDVKYFDDHYGTKNGFLKKDSIYTDPLSFRYSDSLYAGDAMWYYIAEDKDGNKFKGIGPVETEGITLNDLNMRKGLSAFSPLDSKLFWTGYGEIGNYSLSGNLKLKSGTYLLLNDTLKSTHLIFDMQSIESKQDGLSDHLKNADFFESNKFPIAEFILKEPLKINDKMSVNGILTIKDISQPFSLVIEHSLKKKKHIFKGKISFDRTKFNVKYNSKNFFSNLRDHAIKNEIDIDFQIVTEK